MKIYVASSWRNQYQQVVVNILRENGFEVYDFKNPEPGNNGFKWDEIDPNWQNWTAAEFRRLLSHPVAEDGFIFDMKALKECDACVLVLPSGRSAHLEAGYVIGSGKPTIILLNGQIDPELMYKMTPFVCVNLFEVIDCLKLCRGKREAAV